MTTGAIIIGASSGIGRAIAATLSREGYRVGIAARRTELLRELASELTGPCIAKTMDVSQADAAMERLRELIDEVSDVELFIICAGVGFENPSLAWDPEKGTIGVNVVGFTAMANVAAKYLEARGSGHLVGISSIAALRGSRVAPAYNASKAFMSNYLEGLRHRFARMQLPIVVTDVQPGFVDTAMGGGNRFWSSSAETAARQIVAAIHARKSHVYVTRRWRLIAWLLKLAPDALYRRI